MRFRADSPACNGACGVLTNPEIVPSTGLLDTKRLSSNPTFSHVGIVLDADADTVTMYYDGVKVQTKQFPAGHIGSVDCGYTAPEAFVALNMKPEFGNPSTAVNSGGMSGKVADWRMYVGTKLTAADVLKLASSSRDASGMLYQRCQSRGGSNAASQFADDASFRDTSGKDCNWYQDARTKPGGSQVCSSPAVKIACARACGLVVKCYGDKPSTGEKWYRMGDRIMPAYKDPQEQSILCTREGFYAEKECRKNEQAMQSGKKWPASAQSPPKLEYGGVNFDDCRDVEAKADKECQFKFIEPDQNLQNVHALVKESGAITIIFWFRFTQENTPTIVNEITLYQSVFPSRRLLRMPLMKGGQIQLYGTCGKTQSGASFSDVPSPVEFQPGQWYFIAIAWSKSRNMFQLTVNSMTVIDKDVEKDWCLPPVDISGSTDLIQAVEFRGGNRHDISPFAVAPKILSTAELGELYNHGKARFIFRKGALVSDSIRLNSRIEYDRRPFNYQVALSAPPMLLQERVISTDHCKTGLGSNFINKTWGDTISGIMCQPPFECDDVLMTTPTELIVCTSKTLTEAENQSNSSITFFGQQVLQVPVALTPTPNSFVFPEFLQSIADANILVRNDEVFSTKNYIDGSTRYITLLVNTFSSEYGIASQIKVSASFGSYITVMSSVEHFQATEGEDLRSYLFIVTIGWIFAGIIFVEQLYTIMRRTMEVTAFKRKHPTFFDAINDQYNRSELAGITRDIIKVNYQGFLADCIIQVFLPVLYFAIRYQQVSNSAL